MRFAYSVIVEVPDLFEPKDKLAAHTDVGYRIQDLVQLQGYEVIAVVTVLEEL